MEILYTLLYTLGIGLFFPYEYFKRPSLIRKKWIRHKIGMFEIPEKFYHKETIWIHCVSVGEIMALSKLIFLLTERYNVLLSTITDTGQMVAQDKFKELPVHLIYLPFDYPYFIKKTLKHFSPSILLIAETEIWPNLIKTVSRQIPVLLVNGRISERSFKNYQKAKFFFQPILNCFKFLMVQNEVYQHRFKLLGVDERKIIVTGNTKFDIEIPRIDFEWENKLKRPVLIAGSTHDPEEKMIVQSFLKLPLEATLFVAPRHPERFKKVSEEIEKMLTFDSKTLFLKLSQFSSIPEKDHKKLIILVDKIGILGSLYRICDVAIIGGSFIPHGGQNPLEAIYWKKPVIFGPFMQNFPFVKEFVEKKAAFQIDIKDLDKTLKYLLIENPNKSLELAEKAYQIFLKHKGATQKILEKITEII